MTRLAWLGGLVGLGVIVATAGACSSDPTEREAPERMPAAARPGALKETARCDDGVADGKETDVDCGGPCAAKCAVDKGCAKDADCSSDVCIDGLCMAQASRNHMKDGS